jgi:hypothetical protein
MSASSTVQRVDASARRVDEMLENIARRASEREAREIAEREREAADRFAQKAAVGALATNLESCGSIQGERHVRF